MTTVTGDPVPTLCAVTDQRPGLAAQLDAIAAAAGLAAALAAVTLSKLVKKDHVIAEVAAELVATKKGLGEP